MNQIHRDVASPDRGEGLQQQRLLNQSNSESEQTGHHCPWYATRWVVADHLRPSTRLQPSSYEFR